MLSNFMHNLVHALARKTDALTRYSRYKEDGANCPKCASIWNELTKQDTENTELLKEHLKFHLDKGDN